MLLQIDITCFEVFVPDDFWLPDFRLYVGLPLLSIMLEIAPCC